jgi:2,4-diaminopentanoate dehydrogenase
MPERIKVANFGVGVIGSAVVRTIIEKKSDWIEIVAAIDSDPNKNGKDLGDVAGLGRSYGVKVSDQVESTLSSTNPDIVIHTTSSYLAHVYSQLKAIAEQGVDVISSCEELSYPQIVDQNIAKDLDNIARQNDVTILGTGINPGFVMDVLPIVLTSPCVEVEHIRVSRQMNAANRRIPFQKKIGSGMKVEEFKQAIKNGQISGHVGLSQSMSMLADAIGWKLDRIEILSPEPVTLDHAVTGWMEIKPGIVAGTEQKAVGMIGQTRAIEYEFRAYIGAKEEYDAVEIDGTPVVSFRSSPCINGDSGTIAMLINMIPQVLKSKAGLITMSDLPLPSASNMPSPI